MTQSKYTNFQVENSNEINSSILHNQFLIDRDSCSIIVDVNSVRPLAASCNKGVPSVTALRL